MNTLYKVTFFLTAFILLGSSSVSAQAQRPLSITTSAFKGITYYQGGIRINSRAVELTMRTNQEAFQLYQKSNSLASGSSFISAIGGVFIGWPIVTAIAGGEPNWALAGIGGAITITSFVIYSSSKKKAKEAVKVFNNGLSQSSIVKNSTTVQFSIKPTELGISLSF